jgi:hypothetical protein
MSTSPPGGSSPPEVTGHPSATALLLQRHLSAPRLATYVRATGGDLDRAVELYLWNAAVAGALWEVLGHVEVVLRNVLHDALTVRHQRLGRAGQWYDDPARELAQHARDDITRARQRLQRAGAPLLPGKIVAELSFGFWRFLLARRYTATLWPALRPAFRYLPGSDRRLLEAPVARLHVLRNRVAHHEPLLSEPLPDRYTDLLDVVGFVHPQLRSWLDTHNRLQATLAQRP